MKRKTKVILSLITILLVAFGGFYAWGKNYYRRDKQIDWITSALVNPKKDAASYIVADTPTMKVNSTTVKPLQNYYKDHQTDVNKLSQSMKNGIDENGDFTLVQTGHYLLFFPKYQLRVTTYQPEVETNHANSQITVNGKSVGKLSRSNNGSYYKKLSLVFPGRYQVKINSTVAGRDLTASSIVNVKSNKSIDMSIATQTFTVKSVPTGVVYINDEKVGTLDNSGKLTLKSYPLTKNMELYVTYGSDKKQVKSELVTDLEDGFANAEESYSDSTDYSDSASDEDSSAVTLQDNNYVIEPKWQGLISKSDAATLFDDNYNDPDGDSFVGGTANEGYKQIKQENDNWNKSDTINDYSQDATVEAVYPLSSTECQVLYRIDYTFDHDDDTHEQVFEYLGVVQKDGDNYLIKSLGSAKKISDTTTSVVSYRCF